MTGKPDLDRPANIAQFVEAFYGRLLQDELLAPVFLDVAEIKLAEHLPRICSYWEKMLLGSKQYQRNTMQFHRELNAKQKLDQQQFERWLNLFTLTVEESFEGPYAERAKQLATKIAANMSTNLTL